MQSHILRIGDWAQDEDSPVFPVGSQPKTLLVCQEDLQSSEVIPGHKYIFKTPGGWQEHQIWSEVIAYEISLGTRVKVPRSLIAQGSDGRLGVLMEFFYGHPGADHDTRFVHGSDLLFRTILDKKTGRPHGVRTNAILSGRYGVTNAVTWWGEILVFDALIGNSDRHPDN